MTRFAAFHTNNSGQYSRNNKKSGKFVVADIDERLVRKGSTDSDIARMAKQALFGETKTILKNRFDCELLLKI